MQTERECLNFRGKRQPIFLYYQTFPPNPKNALLDILLSKNILYQYLKAHLQYKKKSKWSFLKFFYFIE